MNVQAMVEKWREEQQAQESNPDDPQFCCLVFDQGGNVRKISDCEMRRGENKTHYVASRRDGIPQKYPKPEFISCIRCNVWKMLPPQTATKHPFQMRNRRPRPGYTK